MRTSKTLSVLLFLTVLAYNVAGHEPCDYDYESYYTLRTPEKCAAKCASYNGTYGECFGWTVPLSGLGSCYLLFVDRNATHGEGDYCGLNPVPSVNKSTDSDGETPGSEPDTARCYISTSAVDLGYAPTKHSCESACLGIRSRRYSACLLWLWNEEYEQCEGIMVQKSKHNACGTPPTMPL